MRFRQLRLRCAECGGQNPIRLRRVGLTPHHELLIHFWCGGCKRNNYTLKALSDCWRECPMPDDELVAVELTTDGIREPDLCFLRSLGVKWLDQEEG